MSTGGDRVKTTDPTLGERPAIIPEAQPAPLKALFNCVKVKLKLGVPPQTLLSIAGGQKLSM